MKMNTKTKMTWKLSRGKLKYNIYFLMFLNKTSWKFAKLFNRMHIQLCSEVLNCTYFIKIILNFIKF